MLKRPKEPLIRRTVSFGDKSALLASDLPSKASVSSGSKKIVFAAGGTGGHLFPAQALAEQLLRQKADIELLFAGAKLSENTYFDKTKFAYQDIISATPFRGGLLKALKSLAILFRGIRESIRFLNQQKPDVVVGFGSFHAFPVLCAAALKRIPIILFESNAIPGKVIRLFSKRALLTGIFFSEAQNHLKGKTVDVEIPKKNIHSRTTMHQQEARRLFQLDPNRLTLLVFGGSQGAKNINQLVIDLVPLLHQKNLSFLCSGIFTLRPMPKTAAALSTLCAPIRGISISEYSLSSNRKSKIFFHPSWRKFSTCKSL